MKRFNEQDRALKMIAKNEDIETPVLTLADEIGVKLSRMREEYIQDNWDEPAELLEWLGFFEGGAIVRWGLVRGISEKYAIGDLQQLSQHASLFYNQLLQRTMKDLHDFGRSL